MRRILLLLVFVGAGAGVAAAQEYYNVHEIDRAKAEAKAKHLPMAWLSSYSVYLQYPTVPQGTEFELTSLAVNTLQGQAVVIFQETHPDIPFVPPMIMDQLSILDEGPLPGGHAYNLPKIVFADPGLTVAFARLTAPQLREGREAAINIALLHIHHDPHAQGLINGTIQAVLPTPAAPAREEIPAATMILDGLGPYLPYLIGGIVGLGAIMGLLIWWYRPTPEP